MNYDLELEVTMQEYGYYAPSDPTPIFVEEISQEGNYIKLS